MAENTKPRCFVIGPIGEVGSPIRVDADDFMQYIVTPTVTKSEFGYEPIRADSLNEPGRITSQIIKLLFEADLVIADLTTNNANVYYELCLRHALGKPVIHMAVEGTQLSFDIRDNRTIFYTMHSRAAEVARNELEQQIRHVRRDGYKATNPILETVGIIGFERSSVPEEQAIGRLMAKVSQMDDSLRSIQQALSQNDLFRRTVENTPPGTLAALGHTYFPPGLGEAAGQAEVARKNLAALLRGAEPAINAMDALKIKTKKQ
ncbi:MAG: hypothetical protein WBA48_18800 [Xanthobacteraceae bacterium]